MAREPIIIIDDDFEDLTLFTEAAAEVGIENPIITFNDPEKALSFFRHCPTTPLFIVSDINMPKLTGFQLRSALLEVNSPIKDVPFVFFSTSQSIKESVNAQQFCAKGYFKKPCNFEDLKKTVQEMVNLAAIASNL